VPLRQKIVKPGEDRSREQRRPSLGVLAVRVLPVPGVLALRGGPVPEHLPAVSEGGGDGNVATRAVGAC
jgi:hypothetical protein